ncbi:CAP domain-containing protein [Strongyloides ratti]|nr:CAP domain-containing protein [Strongyloides ratti]CEF66130.1 CAP domain-containing protein [Strongyloides ratti]
MTNSVVSKNIDYTIKTIGSRKVFVYNDQVFNSKEDMMRQIKRDYPNLTFKDAPIPNNNQVIPPQRKDSFSKPNEYIYYGKFDINKFLGPNSFSNKIWHHVWDGCNVECFSRKNFYEMKMRMLKETNMYRRYHRVHPLAEDPYLAKSAQEYAYILAKTKKFMHDPRNIKYGENLGYATLNIASTIVKKWYDEEKLWNYQSTGSIPGAGHFTQLVWRGSQRAGFGIAANGRDVYIVCRYYPAGNVVPYFRQNVFPRQ